jgi:hypothetical protein
MIPSSSVDAVKVSFLNGVAEALRRTDDRERLRHRAMAEAIGFLEGPYLDALEQLFELAEKQPDEGNLRERVMKAAPDALSPDVLAAAAYLHAVFLERRRRPTGV